MNRYNLALFILLALVSADFASGAPAHIAVSAPASQFGAPSKSKMMPTRPKNDRNKSNFQSRIQSAYFHGDLIPLGIELIRSAKSKQELRDRQNQVDQLKLMNGICQSELNGERNPYHCYRVLDVERSMKFISPASAERAQTFLDEHCKASSAEPNDLSGAEIHALSPHCASAFYLSQKRQRYVLSETHPLAHFNSRFEAPTFQKMHHDHSIQPHLPRVQQAELPQVEVMNSLK